MGKILIADDEQQTLDFFSSLVESRCHTDTALKCHNGKVAWDILNDNPEIDLMIVDVAMPEMDGRRLVETIRQDSKVSGLPIIAVSSAVRRPRNIVHLFDMGAAFFMLKSLTVSEMKRFLQAHLPKIIPESVQHTENA